MKINKISKDEILVEDVRKRTLKKGNLENRKKELTKEYEEDITSINKMLDYFKE